MIFSALCEYMHISTAIHMPLFVGSKLFLYNELLSEDGAGAISNYTGITGFLIPDSSPGWYFYLLMGLFISYAVARTFLGRLSSSTFMATVRYSNAASMFNDNSQLQRQRDSVLYGFYFISVGFFSMLFMQKTHLQPYGLYDYKLFLFNTAVIIGVFFSRVIILNLIGHIFNCRTLLREYLYQGFSYNKLIGIVFLPLNFAIVFLSGTLHGFAIYLSISILIILVGLKIFRGIIFSLRNNVFNFYLFLYLCALEIVPMLLLYKWFLIIV